MKSRMWCAICQQPLLLCGFYPKCVSKNTWKSCFVPFLLRGPTVFHYGEATVSKKQCVHGWPPPPKSMLVRLARWQINVRNIRVNIDFGGGGSGYRKLSATTYFWKHMLCLFSHKKKMKDNCFSRVFQQINYPLCLCVMFAVASHSERPKENLGQHWLAKKTFLKIEGWENSWIVPNEVTRRRDVASLRARAQAGHVCDLFASLR